MPENTKYSREGIAQCERQTIEADTKRNKMQVVKDAAVGRLLAIVISASVSSDSVVFTVLAGSFTFGFGTVSQLFDFW